MTAAMGRGLVLRCDMQGRIKDVVRDDLGLTQRLIRDKPFPLLVSPCDMSKALELVAVTGREQAQFGWEISADIDGMPRTLHVDACVVDGEMVLMGNLVGGGYDAHDDVQRMANRQAVMVREMLRSQAREDQAGSWVFEEFIRLNNELANMQRALAARNAELAVALERKDMVLGMAAHDLRSPLNVIAGYAELLHEVAKDRLSDLEIGMVGMIQESSQYMQGLIESVLKWTETVSGKLILRAEDTDLSALLAQVVRMEEGRAALRQVRVQLALPEASVMLSLDSHKIQQVLHNLIGNAIKYSNAGQAVAVSMGLADGGVCLSVTDDGPGLSPQDQDRLFTPFHRGAIPPRDGTMQVGLGLAICRKIIEAHGGTMGVESVLGGPTRFWCALPG